MEYTDHVVGHPIPFVVPVALDVGVSSTDELDEGVAVGVGWDCEDELPD